MKEYIPIRFSHLLRHCSVGAVIRGPNALMTVMDTSHWTDRRGIIPGRQLRYVDRVRYALNINATLREPPIASEFEPKKIKGTCVPAMVFPKWAVCVHCNLLHYLPAIESDEIIPHCQEQDQKKCPKHPRLIQVPYVLVHEDGYMDDLDWHYLTHLGEKKEKIYKCNKRDNSRRYLRLERDKQNPALIWLRCDDCPAKKVFDSRNFARSIKKMARQPWLYDSVILNETPPEILKVNDSRVYSPKTRNALVIPPESRIKNGSVVDRLYNSSSMQQRLDGCKSSLQKINATRRIASELKCTDDEVREAWEKIKSGYPLYGALQNLSPGQLYEDEYKAFINIIPNLNENEDFVTTHLTKEWNAQKTSFDLNRIEGQILAGIEHLISVSRLKEIMTFEGFHRGKGDGRIVRPDIIDKSDWQPAIELFGEGIFFTLEIETLKRWEGYSEVKQRALELQKRYEAVCQPLINEIETVTPRFMILHALSHLIIRQLECDCGYPAAALKERIYSGSKDIQMAGVLIYIVVPDAVGSLGGLAEMASPSRFLALVASALSRADWCSLDPVCSEQEAQGLYQLNRAACHSCLLIPETSCAYQNTLLDRGFVKKNSFQEGSIPSFFNETTKMRG